VRCPYLPSSYIAEPNQGWPVVSEVTSGNGNGKSEALRFVVAMVLAALVAYFTTTGTLSTRMAVAESRIDRLSQDISEIKYDIRKILEAVR